MLSKQELERYKRQIILQGFGEEGQEKLKKARVFIAGAGGLGSPCSTYLAAAGIGTMRIVDPEAIELSNLNRQILHWTGDIEKNKVDSAAEKLSELNPEVKIEPIKERITEDNILKLAYGFDLIVDATDSLQIRYILNKAALELKIPFFHGAVYGFEGRAMTVVPGKSACLMCVYQGVNFEGKIPVIGVTPGIIGCIQATEVIKYITGTGNLLIDRLLIFDGLNMKFTELKVKKDPSCKHCGELTRKS